MIAASILLHLLVFDWANNNFSNINDLSTFAPSNEPAVIKASLHTQRQYEHQNEPLSSVSPASVALEKEAPAAQEINNSKPTSNDTTASTASTASTFSPASFATSSTASIPISSASSINPSNAETDENLPSLPSAPLASSDSVDTDNGKPAESSTPTPPASSSSESSAPSPRYKTNPPPSATLNYKVEALYKNHTVEGHGAIDWNLSANRYRIHGEAGALIFTLLNFSSEGDIDNFGIAPELYVEKRRAQTNTHFNRERNTISFSASTLSYPRQGGEQDRASVVWQLASIGRGDAEKFIAGAEIDIFVAGVRNAETWRMRIVGIEEIDTGLGKTQVWHIARLPQPDSYEEKLDIWLAPQRDWYPVRLRYTQNNGDYIDMMLVELNKK